MATHPDSPANPATEIVAVDMFCGAGGFSEALSQLCTERGWTLHEVAINHWHTAIQSHRQNHPDAAQYHAKVEGFDNPSALIDDVVDEDIDTIRDSDVSVDILVGGPECTHFSSARGGKPVNDQHRSSPWELLSWVSALNPSTFVVENVKEIMSWGPIVNGQPTRDGSIFETWVNILNDLGYSVNWTTLNAAQYGDPTSRERFFLVGSKTGQATFPEPTHSSTDPSLPDPRPAAEIIDWTDTGTSIWTRDLTEPRVHSPPKDTTLKRIAEGLRRHSHEALEPFATVLENLTRDSIKQLRQNRVVAPADAPTVAAATDTPFLVPTAPEPSQGVAPTVTQTPDHNSQARPEATVGEPVMLRQQDGAHPTAVHDTPVPTIATGGGHALVTPSLVMPKNYPKRGIHSNSLYDPTTQPFHTVTADPRAKLVSPQLAPLGQPLPTDTTAVQPFIDDYEGAAGHPNDPLKTVTSRGRFALCVPELYPHGLDIKYRMLHPRELKQAQGFPASYELAGAKTDKTEQIGNAVPVHLAKAICEHVLTATEPSLTTFGAGLTDDELPEIPSYDEVSSPEA